GKMQTERWIEPGIYPKPGIADMREVVIYRSVDDGSLWVRPREEFDDGRFIALAPNTTMAAGCVICNGTRETHLPNSEFLSPCPECAP
ncbi:DUF1653 domain-containing protein, partial [Ochrobactrum sp. SFR4]|nr:DUF1653 domain-containing protein [Ochrobactrum sp. SFR4]